MSDQSKTGPSMWERSTFVRFFRWLLSWRVIRCVAIVLAWMVTIIALWYGEENWRGRRAWNQYRKATEARGESLNFTTYIPTPVPDDQNFAETPFLKSFILQRNVGIMTNDFYARATDRISETNIMKDRGHRHFTDLVAWQQASDALQNGQLKPGPDKNWRQSGSSAALLNGQLKREQKFETTNTNQAARAAAAPAILEGMKSDQAAFAELRAASTREFSRYPLNYNLDNPWGILLPHLAGIKMVCQRLNLEACADLAVGQSGQALADEKLMLALADSIKSEPFLISFLVRRACIVIAIQPIWEGLAERRWTEGELQELQACFLSYNFLADLEQPLKAEKALGVLTADLFKKKGFKLVYGLFDYDSTDPWIFERAAISLLFKFMPSGWYDLEKLNYCTLYDAEGQGVMDPVAKVILPSKVAVNHIEETKQIFGSPSSLTFKAVLRHQVIASLTVGARNYITAATAQTATDQAALACALERYRLARGQFPDQLDALTPQYMSRLPNDVITGQPYKYHRTDNGQFILYSVGWNEKDDGGVPGKTLFDQTQGDWVWSYPSK